MRPFTAAAISGSAAMVERPESSLRAPWLETMIPSSPYLTASSGPRGRDALGQDFHLGDIAQALEIPRHGGRLETGEALMSTSGLVHEPCGLRLVPTGVLCRGHVAHSRESWYASGRGLLVAAAGAIHRPRDACAAVPLSRA